MARKELRKYPLVVLFFAFLAVFSLVNALLPDQERSEMENRRLEQFPEISLQKLMANEWTGKMNTYVNDQLLGRDSWISVYSALETAQGKLEANGVWLGKDAYQFAKTAPVLSGEMARQLEVNTGAVAELAARQSNVQVMIVPSAYNVLEDKLRGNPPRLDENALLDDIYSQLHSAGAVTIDLRDVYALHSEEYLFYRTDHHWTTTGGAWYAYEAYCASAGLAPVTPSAPLVEIEGFLGTNYAKSKYIGTKADTLAYYDFAAIQTIYEFAGDEGYEAPLMDAQKLEEYDKYAAFLGGNNGYAVLQGEGEGSVLVFKDSYGNSFVPYLLQNYATVGVVDLRSWQQVDATIAEGEYDDILVLYCFESFATDNNLYRMMDAAQK